MRSVPYLWLDDNESHAGLLLTKPRCFVEECVYEVIDKSSDFR
ncbi:hypothetical protein SAMN05444159_1484 [Bradyrhizobium lablabi]|uniref:Uncharacterized protein n=1 Tax=Bradyrhizobium lablabi TaxID=722472 RepID=A0A1M6M4Z8_9BRAD|nr:hypothetical protein SAMN05444159_1484 [Bradyrhizobium lablabi]